MNIEGVIFDLDGTLVHTIEDIGDAANTMLKRHDLPLHTTSDYLKWIGNGAAKFIDSALPLDITTDQQRDYVNEFKEIYALNLTHKSRLYEDIPAMLNQLNERGVKLAILSNKPHHLTKKVAEFYLSEWGFNPVFGQREHIPRKPDPAAANEIAALLRIDENRILFVGDSEGDLRTAEAAGMIPVGVTWGYGRVEPFSDNGQIIINNPQELLELLD